MWVGIWLTKGFHLHWVLLMLELEAGLLGQTREEQEDSHCVGGFEETSDFFCTQLV